VQGNLRERRKKGPVCWKGGGEKRAKTPEKKTCPPTRLKPHTHNHEGDHFVGGGLGVWWGGGWGVGGWGVFLLFYELVQFEIATRGGLMQKAPEQQIKNTCSV